MESWQGPGVGEEGEAGRLGKKEWGGEGETGGGQWGGDWEGGWRGGNLKGEMERGQQEGGDGRGAKGRGRRRGKRRGILQMDMMECYRIELQADRMSGVTEAMAFTDSYKHM